MMMLRKYRLLWLSRIALCMSVFLILAASTRAEPVSVNKGAGQGLIFNHRGNCYLILPGHVHGRARTVTLVTASPPAVGDATIFRTFEPAADLSIGLVSGGLDERCQETWDSLPDRTDALLDRSQDAVLTRVFATGLSAHDAMRITSRGYEMLAAAVMDPAMRREIYGGTSGAIMRVDGTVVGMTIESPNAAEATVLRIDEIKSRLSRLLDARGSGREFTDKRPKPAPAENQIAEGAKCPSAEGLHLATVICGVEPVSPEFACSRLIQGGAIRLPPLRGPVRIVLVLDRDKPAPLHAVHLGGSSIEATGATPPKTIRIEVDSSTGDSRHWRAFGVKDMTPFGTLSVVNGAAPFASRVRLTLESSWDADKPVELGCVGFE